MTYVLQIIWTIQDVLELKDSLTDEQCEKVLRRAYNEHDADVGINWEVLNEHLEDILEEERQEKQASKVKK